MSNYDNNLGQSVTNVYLKATLPSAALNDTSNPQNIRADAVWFADDTQIAQYENMILNYDQSAEKFYTLLPSTVWGESLGKTIKLRLSSNNMGKSPLESKSYFIGIVAVLNKETVFLI
jgi:hypothetical protein